MRKPRSFFLGETGQANVYHAGTRTAARENGHHEGVGEIASRLRSRLFDLSMFMKELKMKMTAALQRGARPAWHAVGGPFQVRAGRW